MGLAFLGGLARKRSLGSAALLFLVLVDEMEALCFMAVGVLLQRPDLFLALQDVLFPAVLFVAGVASAARNWRTRRQGREVALPVEMLELSTIAQRIGAATH